MIIIICGEHLELACARSATLIVREIRGKAAARAATFACCAAWYVRDIDSRYTSVPCACLVFEQRRLEACEECLPRERKRPPKTCCLCANARMDLWDSRTVECA